MTKTTHVHKFKRVVHKSGNAVFFCTLPDCSHKINTAFALGKRCICWRCEQPFIMTEYSLRLAKPHCENCHKPKEQKFISRIESEPIAEPISSMDVKVNLSLADRLAQAMKPKEQEEDI